MAPIRSVSQLDPRKSYSYADYLAWQFEGWEELHRGRLVLPPDSLGTKHQQTAGNLLAQIIACLKGRAEQVYPRISVALPHPAATTAPTQINTVVVPDLCVICDRTKLDERGCLGAPDWVIEILSPGTAARDMHDKFDLYEESGVGEYWIVAPLDRNISVFVLDAVSGRYRTVGDYATPGPVPSHTLPEMVLEWEEVWAE
jgi:Uma2 family endonuclease